MPPLFSGFCVFPSVLLRKNPLPTPFGMGIGVFTVKCTRQEYTPPTLCKVFVVNAFDVFQMIAESDAINHLSPVS